MALVQVLIALLISCSLAAATANDQVHEIKESEVLKGPPGVSQESNGPELTLSKDTLQANSSATQPTSSEHSLTEGATGRLAKSNPDKPAGSEETSKVTGSKKEELKFSLEELIELARKSNEKLQQEQRLVDQKLAGRDLLKDEHKLNNVQNTEELIKYIVSLVVPDVLKALLPLKSKKMSFEPETEDSKRLRESLAQEREPAEEVEASNQAGAQAGEEKEVDAKQAELRPKRPFGQLLRKPAPNKLGPTIQVKFKPLPWAGSWPSGKLVKHPADKKKGVKSQAPSGKRQNQKQLVDSEAALELAVKLLQSLRAGEKLADKKAKPAGSSKSFLSDDLRLRKARKQESRRIESKASSQQVVNDSLDLNSEHGEASSSSESDRDTKEKRDKMPTDQFEAGCWHENCLE